MTRSRPILTHRVEFLNGVAIFVTSEEADKIKKTLSEFVDMGPIELAPIKNNDIVVRPYSFIVVRYIVMMYELEMKSGVDGKA